MRHTLFFLLLTLFMCSCGPSGSGSGSSSGSGTPAGFIDDFGTHASPSGTLTVEVTRRDKLLVDFAVVEKATGKRLVSEYVGSDAMRWFLWWETPARLWGYGSDIGYFKVFDFASGGATTTAVTKEMPVPPVVWDHLPNSAHRRYRVAPIPVPKK